MTEIIVNSGSDGHLFDGKSDEELEKILNSLTPEGAIPEEILKDLAPKEEAAPAPPAEEAAPPAEEAPKEEAAPPAEPDIDEKLKALEVERIRNEKERLEARLRAQEAHASRLAGELGFVKNQLKSVASRPTEPYQPESEAELDRLSKLERQVQDVETHRVKAEVQAAINETIAGFQSPDLEALMPYINQVAPNYRQQMDAAKETNDPALARQIADAVTRSAIADAKELKFADDHKALMAQKTASTSDMAKAKKAATISASGAVPAAPPKPKTFADMTAEEADRWLRENVR